MAAHSLALVSLGFSTNSRHWNKPKKKKTVGAFSERPGKISSPLRQTVLSTWPFHALFLVREHCFFRGLFSFFFFIADLHVMYHLCRYFILCTLTWRQRTWIVSLFNSFFSLFNLRVAILFIFYSSIRPAQLDSSYKRNQTLHLFACVCDCVYVWMIYVHVYDVCQGLLLSVPQLVVKLMYIVCIALHHWHVICSLKQTWYSS